MALTFRAGIHPPDKKNLSEKKIICELTPKPAIVSIPLSQHIGKPAVPCVAVGDKVRPGQLIAKADGIISADIFASIAGEVTGIKELPALNGRCTHIIINGMGADPDNSDPVYFECLKETASPKDIIERIKAAGIVGMGGAGFPTSFKISSADKVDEYVINAAECEPYITCDNRIMIEYPEQFLRGCLLLKRASGAKRAIVAVEENKPDAIIQLKGYIERLNLDVSVAVLKTKYPQGAEKQLIYAVTGKKVGTGKLPNSVNVIVSNVHTALAVYFAVTKGQPLYRRIVTVTGGGIAEPKNIWVPVGTPFSVLTEFAGGYDEERTVKLLSGGPMMGIAIDNLDYAVTKTASCLLFMTEAEAFTGDASACISCGKCARACPMRLMPMYIDAYALVADCKNAEKYGANNCIECGCCSYVCPSKRPLVQSIRLAKKKIAALKSKGGAK